MDDFLDGLYPELTLETDDIIMSLTIKKDLIKDLKDFIDEFSKTPESDDFVRYFDD